ncbi:UNKNOWN [Stylonychia lemnae]|uniref:Uncharacterized protein n=1 Tax=Stylonychia lemnae TaxID=5949 RepID=A0A078B8J8_STYLE|nr:UNKNOWN [Stylonychia lemnae]|eukprot:CDW90734.1 UNKNOWN [Stylonychia lemnae]
MIKRDLDEEQVFKNIIPLHRREPSKLNISIHNGSPFSVTSSKLPYSQQIKNNIAQQLTIITSNCEKYVQNQSRPINFLNSNKQSNHYTSVTTPDHSIPRKLPNGRHSRNYSQNYPNIAAIATVAQVNQTQLELPDIQQQMQNLTQDIRNAKSISSVIKNYQDSIKTIKDKNIDLQIMGDSHREKQGQTKLGFQSIGLEPMESNSSFKDFHKKITLVYDDQNQEKIKNINEILNRSLGHRAKLGGITEFHNSFLMNHQNFIKKRIIKPNLPTILTKTLHIQQKKIEKHFPSKKSSVPQILEEVSDSEVFMNKELKKALHQGSPNRYRDCLALKEHKKMTAQNKESTNIDQNAILSRQLRHRPILRKIKVANESRSISLKKLENHATTINLTMPERIIESESIAQIEARSIRKKVLQKSAIQSLIIKKKFYERDSSQLRQWQDQHNINTDLSLDVSLYNSPEKLKSKHHQQHQII